MKVIANDKVTLTEGCRLTDNQITEVGERENNYEMGK